MRLFGFLKKNNSDIINKLIGSIFEKSREYIDLEDNYPETFNEYKSDIFYLSIVRLELEKILIEAGISKSDIINNFEKRDSNFFCNLKLVIALFNETSRIYNKADYVTRNKIDKNYEKCVSYLTKVKNILYNEALVNDFFESCSINFVIDSASKISVINSEIIELRIQIMKAIHNRNIMSCNEITGEMYKKFNQIYILAYNIQSLKRTQLSLELMISTLGAVRSSMDKLKDEIKIDKLNNGDNEQCFDIFQKYMNIIEEYCEIIQCEINKMK